MSTLVRNRIGQTARAPSNWCPEVLPAERSAQRGLASSTRSGSPAPIDYGGQRVDGGHGSSLQSHPVSKMAACSSRQTDTAGRAVPRPNGQPSGRKPWVPLPKTVSADRNCNGMLSVGQCIHVTLLPRPSNPYAHVHGQIHLRRCLLKSLPMSGGGGGFGGAPRKVCICVVPAFALAEQDPTGPALRSSRVVRVASGSMST